MVAIIDEAGFGMSTTKLMFENSMFPFETILDTLVILYCMRYE